MTARHVWNEIGAEFNRLREKGRGIAWKTFQKRINEQGGILLEIFSGKDLVELSMKIEDYIQADSGADEESGLDFVRNFLSDKKPVKEKRVH